MRFPCRHVKICETREQLAALPPGPKAVLATLPSLEAGIARDLLVDWAGDSHSLILFTERPPVRKSIPYISLCSSSAAIFGSWHCSGPAGGLGKRPPQPHSLH